MDAYSGIYLKADAFSRRVVSSTQPQGLQSLERTTAHFLRPKPQVVITQRTDAGKHPLLEGARFGYYEHCATSLTLLLTRT
ncbi:unnamed protein product, partial [marine sediment metagenome]